MPTIEAYTDHPTHPYVRVEVTWADLPQVTQAAVYRVDVQTGACTPLRPYICYDGWELLLSCGHGIWWDTEAPFDRPFYYITTSTQAPCVPQVLFRSSFETALVDSWGSTDTGTVLSPLAYTLAGGTVPGDYDVNGGRGRMSLPTVTTDRTAAIDIGRTDFDLYASFSTNQIAVVQDITTRIMGRFTDALNSYEGGINFAPDGTVLAFIARIVGGVEDILAIAFGISGYAPDIEWTVRFWGYGNEFKLKAWPSPLIEPDEWLFEVTDTPQPTLTSTQVGILSRRDTGNTNVGLITSTDNFIGVDECLPCVPVTVDTSGDPITLASDGRFWLKDPVRPCHDRPVPLCPTDTPRLPGCGGGSGILFVGTGPEIYPANSLTMRPMNRRRNLSATRPRGDASSSLRLQTTTFADRDDLLQLTAPGSLLLWQGPAEFGISDRYMNVTDVQVSPELPDLRIQVRTETLPYDIQDRPAGPTQGICGARVVDICDTYPTWADLAATGMTWDDLVAGQATPASANPNARTWTDVDNQFASWDAVNTGGRTWQGLQEGD